VSESAAAEARDPTGVPEIDAALDELDHLPDRPISEHHDHLARAHETLHAALNRTDQVEPG
jgi:hypothetical protein